MSSTLEVRSEIKKLAAQIEALAWQPLPIGKERRKSHCKCASKPGCQNRHR